MNDYLVGKVHADPHNEMFGIKHITGFDCDRQISQSFDAVPEHDKLITINELCALVKVYGGNAVNMRSLYGFRLLLKN